MRRISLVFYQREAVRADWSYRVDEARLEDLVQALNRDLNRFDIEVVAIHDDAVSIAVHGYGDLLNAIRLRDPGAGFGNLCLGHILGASPNRDLYEDIRRGVNRLAFAPETIEPEGSDKVVCHNCGCGC